MAYTSDEIIVFYSVVGFFSGLSMLGCLFVCLVYLYNQELRVMSFKLVVCLSIAGFGNSLCNIYSAYILPKFMNQTACTIQAFLVVYFSLCALIWTFIIALTIYIAVIQRKEISPIHEFYFHVVGWFLPLVAAALPLISDSYDTNSEDNLWCWISKDKRIINHVWRGLVFYIPLWLCILANFYIYYIIRRNLTHHVSFIATDVEVMEQLVYRLRLYPVILLTSELGTSFYRSMQLIDEDMTNNYELPIVAVTISTLVGLVNSIVYGLNPTVRNCISKYFKKLRIHSNTVSENNLLSKSLELK